MLPRVEDLEHSIQWTSLASDIDDLEKLRRRNRRGAIERHAYQRVSMPEMQRACTVTCGDNDRLHTPLNRDNLEDYLEPENCRWSWKPRTDFEREYFYKDYKDYYYGDSAKYPSFYDSSSRDGRGCPVTRQETQRPVQSSPGSVATRSGRFRSPVGLEREHFSDSRDRLHEIFEHNRYLRRQFFAGAPANARQDGNGFSKYLRSDRGNQEASRRYAGFGSTETLTSQSNQSSVSSIHERKSRARATRSPDDEEDVLTELVGRNGVVATSSRRTRKSGHSGGARQDGKLLVNILPGSEIRRVNVRNMVTAKLDEATDESSEDGARTERMNGDEMLDKSSQCDDEIAARQETEKSLPEYIFGSTVNHHREAREGDPDDRLERKREQFSQCGTRSFLKDEQLDSILNTNVPGPMGDDGTYLDLRGSLPNLTIVKRNLEAPLYVARAVNVPEPAGSTEYDLHARIMKSNRDSGLQYRERRSERNEMVADPTRSNSRGQSASKTTSCSQIPCARERLTSRRRVKAVRIPPPLDLSGVNEQCERMEAEERRHLNDYSVDVAILRGHEDIVEGLLTAAGNGRIIKSVVHGRDTWRITGNDESCGRKKNRRLSSRPLHKSCGDLSLADDLQSPQLVNNCKSSVSDLRKLETASTRIARRPIDPDAGRCDRATSPLFDRTSSIGGFQAGSALPSTVYGPIPYSQ